MVVLDLPLSDRLWHRRRVQGLGFAVHVLWYVLIVAVLLWLIGFFVGGMEGGRRRWYGRW
jgi:hypothetical protein